MKGQIIYVPHSVYPGKIARGYRDHKLQLSSVQRTMAMIAPCSCNNCQQATIRALWVDLRIKHSRFVSNFSPWMKDSATMLAMLSRKQDVYYEKVRSHLGPYPRSILFIYENWIINARFITFKCFRFAKICLTFIWEERRYVRCFVMET